MPEHHNILPFYKKLKLKVEALLIDNEPKFYNTDKPPSKLYLALNYTEAEVLPLSATTLDAMYKQTPHSANC